MLYWRQGMSFNQVGAGVSDNVRTARSQVRDGRLVSVRQRVGMRRYRQHLDEYLVNF